MAPECVVDHWATWAGCASIASHGKIVAMGILPYFHSNAEQYELYVKMSRQFILATAIFTARHYGVYAAIVSVLFHGEDNPQNCTFLL